MICQQLRGRPVQAPMRSMLSSESRCEVLPWQDVIIDVQGPYTVGENGEQYLLSYHCTRLKVPKLSAFRALKPGPFLRALTTCIFKSRVIPDTVRSDRGPEMTNLICLLYTSPSPRDS